MNQILLTTNICGLMALIVICWLIWKIPPLPKIEMLCIPVDSVIMRRDVEITLQGGLRIFTGITGWDWKRNKPIGGPLIVPPINDLQWHGGELRTLVIF